MPRLVLRIDVTPRIGLGHLRRAMSLASEGALQGVQSVFAAPRPDWPRLLAEGVPSGSLVEPSEILSAAGRGGAVLMDTQWSGNAAAAAQEAEALVAAGLVVGVIDSLPPDQYDAPPGRGGVHLVITPYLGAERFRGPPSARRWLAGPKYAVLDPAFAAARAAVRRDSPRRMLFACGGSDPEGATARFLDRLPEGGLDVDVVVGPLFTDALRSRVERQAAARTNVTLHRAPPNLARLIAGASVVAGRAGLQRYEAAALGRTGVYVHYGNSFRDYFSAFGAAGVAQVHFADGPADLDAFLEHSTTVAGWRGHGPPPPELAFNEAAFEAVDCDGARRVIQAVREFCDL